jgi:DNA-binding SARP family transcriptional activator
VGVEYRLLGPLEAIADGQPAQLGGGLQRGVLVCLLAQPNAVVPATRIIDELWAEDPPPTAANLVQGYVSQLRKALGRDAIETRGTGYVARVDPDALDLIRFERLADAGSQALAEGRVEPAAAAFAEALALWRGPALADLDDRPFLRPTAARLNELRLLAHERWVEARLACGRDAEVIGEIRAVVAEHPLRERPLGLLMLALYRSGRQAEALEAYRTARKTFLEELGIEPGPWLRELERSILRQDSALEAEATTSTVRHDAVDTRTIVLAAFELAELSRLLDVAEPLARDAGRELVLACTVVSPSELGMTSDALHGFRATLVKSGVAARAAAFTSLTPGADLTRLAVEQDAELVVVGTPERLLEDVRLLTLLSEAPCDVAVVGGGPLGDGPVIVPFTGAEHDWAAVELAGRMGRARDVPLRLLGSAGRDDKRDASRLLASASLAVQRALGVVAEPLLVDPSPAALATATESAGIVVIGLTERWRHDGLGRTRTTLATASTHATVLVRRGLRPGGLAPRGSQTHFTWTIGAPAR